MGRAGYDTTDLRNGGSYPAFAAAYYYDKNKAEEAGKAAAIAEEQRIAKAIKQKRSTGIRAKKRAAQGGKEEKAMDAKGEDGEGKVDCV